MKLRFAPSPTGYIHVGNCRTLLINWLFAKANKGQFLLRLDDTDYTRSEEKYETALLEDMAWLGLDFDAYEKQSDRMDRYHIVAETLKKSGRLYPCYETTEELEVKRKQKAAQGLPPLYDRSALKLTDAQKAAYASEGRKPHWRFLIQDDLIEWNDLIRGHIKFEGKHLGDPVLIREDGIPLYTLASVVDDMDMGITHILRGEDHLSNTAVQVQLWEAIGLSHNITFGHLSLLQGMKGEQLSKRLGTQSIRDFRAQGILPMTVNSLLGKIGTSDSVDVFSNLQSLIESFDISKFSKATPKFSRETLEQLNTKLIHNLSFDDVKKHLQFSEITQDFWEGVRANLTRLDDIKTWWDVCCGDVSTFSAEEDHSFIETALSLLPEGPWEENPWTTWVDALKEKTGRKGKGLFMPLRRALTGQDHGPELKTILQLMGPARARARIEQALSK